MLGEYYADILGFRYLKPASNPDCKKLEKSAQLSAATQYGTGSGSDRMLALNSPFH